MVMLRYDATGGDDGEGGYVPLRGGSRNFVPRRHTARAILGDVRFKALANGDPCTLESLNQTNVSGSSRTVLEIGQDVVFDLMADGLENQSKLLSEQARVVEVINDSFGCSFELEFLDGIKLDKLSQDANTHFKRQVLSDDISGGAQHLPPAYAMLSIELLHYLAGLRLKADLLEAAGDGTLEGIFRDARRLMSSHGNEFRDLWYRFNDVIADIPYDDDAFAAVKWHTDRVLRPHFMGAPVFARSFEKPLGYPGDYQIMLHAYDSATPVETPTLYDAVLQQFFSHGFGACIRSRMALAVDAIHINMEENPSGEDETYEILNVGCGAAVELPSLIQGTAARTKSVHIRLLDQDDRPLQYAYQHAAEAISSNRSRCEVTAYNMSFLELYRAGRLTEENDVGLQNVVYSLGLLDYFKALRAKRFVEALYTRVKPGGLLIICNVAKTRVGCEWILECLTDWRLEYRTIDHMNALFVDLPDNPKVTIRLEESKQMWVAVVEKPV